MAVRSISLVVTDSRAVSHFGIPARQITFQFVQASNVTAKLFVVENKQVAGETLVEYRTVASAADLSNLTEDAPPNGSPARPYRVDTVTLTTDEPSLIDKFIDTVRDRTRGLLETLKQLELSTSTTYTITV